MRLFCPALLSLCLFAVPAAKAAGPALGDGETLTYRVGWAFLGGVGEIKISARSAPAGSGQPQLLVTTETATRGLVRALFEFTAKAESIFDAKTGRMLKTSETSKANEKETKNSVTFDYAKATAHYVDDIHPEKTTTIPMPAGDPMDLIMSLVQTRAWNLKPGDQHDILVIFDGDFYELTVHADHYEEIRTPLGTFQTLLLVPRMEKTPPKGMFKRGSNVRVWISQDERHLPVQFQVEFKVGMGTAHLVSYEPSAAAKATGATSLSLSADNDEPIRAGKSSH